MSIWDKVFEIRTDRQGKEYIFSKLPVATQYGITMYANGGDIDLPSLYAGLPIDGKTLIRDEKGVLMVNPDIELGGGVSNFWDLSGIPSWITNSKPKYRYSEIEGTPDLSVYAQVDTLKAYVTLAGAQTLTGEKNFTGGLKVNGSPIIYDSANKYWKLQGNLVLTGGITMYADDGTLNLPSIYDGLPIDGTSIYWEYDSNGNKTVLKAQKTGFPETVDDKTFYYEQQNAASVWNIVHNMGKKPSVMVFDSANDEVHGNIFYNDNNRITLSFSSPFSGVAILN